MKTYKLKTNEGKEVTVIEDLDGEWMKVSDFKEYKEERVGAFNLQDIYDACSARDLKIQEETALDIMAYLQHHFDASIGVNWDVVHMAIDEIVGRNNA